MRNISVNNIYVESFETLYFYGKVECANGKVDCANGKVECANGKVELLPFPIVSVAVSITVFARFNRCSNIFQSTDKTLEQWNVQMVRWNYRRFQSFQSLFGSQFSLASIAVR